MNRFWGRKIQKRASSRVVTGERQGRTRAVRIQPHHRDVLAFPDGFKPQGLQRGEHPRLRRVDGKLGHLWQNSDSGLRHKSVERRDLRVQHFRTKCLYMKFHG